MMLPDKKTKSLEPTPGSDRDLPGSHGLSSPWARRGSVPAVGRDTPTQLKAIKYRKRILITALVVLVACASAAWLAIRPRDPLFRGMQESYWIEHLSYRDEERAGQTVARIRFRWRARSRTSVGRSKPTDGQTLPKCLSEDRTHFAGVCDALPTGTT